MYVQKIRNQKYFYPNLVKKYLDLCHRKKSSLGLWSKDVNTEIKLNIEKHWKDEVRNHKYISHRCDKKYYVLPMFPYPSGNLHMGHVRVYSISDTLTRFQELNGNHTIHPIGWDAFGLPAENAAIEHNIPPPQWTKSNINSMKQQLKQLGFNFDWDREISTCNPDYYKWTQFIFLKLFENGLAYQSKAKVNWDPVDKTVLADEQVDDLGCSWRSGATVETKYLTQWFIKTTQYAKKLYDGLNSEHLENWKDIINLQKHWIGECNGIEVLFKLKLTNDEKLFNVWTSDPYKFIHGNFLTISPSHVALQHLENKPNVLYCINPITESEMPVYVTNAAPYPEGREVLIACPTIDIQDHELASSLNISIPKVAITVNIENENKKAIDRAISKRVGGHLVSSKLKDWLISRQRYWGTPIPIIHCPGCGPVPVPYNELPVKLPDTNTLPQGVPSLANIDEWINCKCPKCNSNAKRETDTMDTFVDSSWYYYRFLDPHNQTMPFDRQKIKDYTPVDIYVGGKEHAVLHLYYARFMSYFLHYLGWTPSEEPFTKLVVQGMVMGQSYKVKSSGKYIPADNVEKVGKQYKEKGTGEPLLVQWEKMSKSKYNGENPERLLSTYGCDTTRLLMLADVPPATTRHWSDATLPGILNWQRRLWLTMRDFLKYRSNMPESVLSKEAFEEIENKIYMSRNFLTATTTYHFRYTQKISVAISRLQSLTSLLRNNVPPEVIARSEEFEKALISLIIMVSPVIPHFASELWAGVREGGAGEGELGQQRWPVVDPQYPLSFLCKVDGADRCDLKVKACDLVNIDEEKALQIMINEKTVRKWLKRGILRTKYEMYPDCRAVLSIYTNKPDKTVETQKEEAL